MVSWIRPGNGTFSKGRAGGRADRRGPAPILAFMDYPLVEDGHIVPAGYLRGFADGSMITRHDVAAANEGVRSVRSVGVRERPYSRQRPDGTRIDDIEWSLSQLEQHVGVLRKAEELYPYTLEDRSIIAQWAGLQQVRGPRWFQEHDEQLDEFIEQLGERGLPDVDALRMIPPARLRQAGAGLRGSTDRLMLMIRSMHQATAAFMAMHWTVLVFRSPVLATSDHPIVLWPATDQPRRPADGAGKCGLLETLEVRYPLTARTCLLMTWQAGPDPDRVVAGKHHHAKNINAFTIAQADEEWFSLPETSPPVAAADERLLPLGPELCPGYNAEDVVHSDRRALVEQQVREMRGKPLVKNPVYPAIVVSRT